MLSRRAPPGEGWLRRLLRPVGQLVRRRGASCLPEEEAQGVLVDEEAQEGVVVRDVEGGAAGGDVAVDAVRGVSGERASWCGGARRGAHEAASGRWSGWAGCEAEAAVEGGCCGAALASSCLGRVAWCSSWALEAACSSWAWPWVARAPSAAVGSVAWSDMARSGMSVWMCVEGLIALWRFLSWRCW